MYNLLLIFFINVLVIMLFNDYILAKKIEKFDIANQIKEKMADIDQINDELDQFIEPTYLYDNDKCMCFQKKDYYYIGLIIFSLIMLRFGYFILLRLRYFSELPIKRDIIV